MIANQDSEDDTRGGGAHGPPLSFRESFWGTVAPRVPKHPPLREPPPKNIKQTPNWYVRLGPWRMCPVAWPALQFQHDSLPQYKQVRNNYHIHEAKTCRRVQCSPQASKHAWAQSRFRGPPRGGGRAQAHNVVEDLRIDEPQDVHSQIAVAAAPCGCI